MAIAPWGFTMKNHNGMRITAHTVEIYFEGTSLEDLAQALAEGEHDLGFEASQAGYAIYGMWPNMVQS